MPGDQIMLVRNSLLAVLGLLSLFQPATLKAQMVGEQRIRFAQEFLTRDDVQDTSGLLELTQRGWEAFDELASAQGFSDHSHGNFRGKSPLAQAWANLAAEREARRAFTLLADYKNVVTQIYALCGLYWFDPELFEQRARKLRSSTEWTSYVSGCIGETATLSQIVYNPNHATIRIDYPGQAIDEWRKAKPSRLHEIEYDIEGGGYPTMLAGVLPE